MLISVHYRQGTCKMNDENILLASRDTPRETYNTPLLLTATRMRVYFIALSYSPHATASMRMLASAFATPRQYRRDGSAYHQYHSASSGRDGILIQRAFGGRSFSPLNLIHILNTCSTYRPRLPAHARCVALRLPLLLYRRRHSALPLAQYVTSGHDAHRLRWRHTSSTHSGSQECTGAITDTRSPHTMSFSMTWASQRPLACPPRRVT